MARDVFIVGIARTPIGAFQGALATVPAPELGAVAIRTALERAGVKPEEVGEVFMGNVLTAGIGQAPARQAALKAGLPESVPCTQIGKVCGSGLQATILGYKTVALGDAEVVVSGGMENMSLAPYLLPGARTGYRMGPKPAVDSMVHDGLWDPYNDFHMGNAAELNAKEYGFSREAQDEYARESYTRAKKAQEDGTFAKVIAPVTVKGRKGDTVVDTDEEPGRANFEKMPKLRTAFQKDGTVTAANASKLNDGAAALVLASGEAVEKLGLTPLGKITAYGAHAQAPEWFTTAPVGAMEKAFARAGLGVDDIDVFEVNEAFAVVSMSCVTKLNVPHAKMNVLGGAIALGHPIGASGARILVTLLNAMESKSAKRGMASICIGGGEGLALIVER
ncbi:MAG: thiolase family protein [Myxococcota bacterium]